MTNQEIIIDKIRKLGLGEALNIPLAGQNEFGKWVRVLSKGNHYQVEKVNKRRLISTEKFAMDYQGELEMAHWVFSDVGFEQTQENL